MGTFLFLEWGDILVVAFKLQRVVVSCHKRTELAPTDLRSKNARDSVPDS